MSRRSNAARALESARRAEATAYLRLLEIPTRTREDVATAPVVGDSLTLNSNTYALVSPVAPLAGRVEVTRNGEPLFPTLETWGWLAASASHVSPVEHPARIARRLVWERAAARRETARATLDALPPAGHKRRKDGTCYPVQGPRENAAAKAGRDAWKRAAGRSLAFMGVALAFVALFLSACN